MRILISTLLLLLTATEITAAEPAQDASPYAVEVSVGYVVVPFVAIGSDGRPVERLRERDVQLYVDGRRVRPDMFETAADAPVSFTILLDGSGSMGLAGKFQSARVALRQLLKNARPQDDFALHVFSEGVVREVVPFTHDSSAILAALGDIEPWGKTAFYDALAKMPDQSILGSNGSRAIVIFTDALDNASQLTRSQLTSILEGVDVPVYAMGIRLGEDAGKVEDAVQRERMTDLGALQQVAESSGGRVVVAASAGELIHGIAAMNRDLRSQYLLGFSPTGKGGVRFRPIEIRLARGHTVRTRAGYRGTEPPTGSRTSRAGTK